LMSSLDASSFDEVVDLECKWLVNFFSTDPEDQSAWLYHRWLLGQVVRGSSVCELPLLTISLGSPLITHQTPSKHNFEKKKQIEVLSRELTMCEDLLRIAPNCKWVLLTTAVLASALHYCFGITTKRSYKLDDIFSHLIEQDSMRKGYYRDIQALLQSTKQQSLWRPAEFSSVGFAWS